MTDDPLNGDLAAVYRVILPRTRGKDIAYPPRGHGLYTRQQAIDLLKRLASRGITDAYAEAPDHRFDLDWLAEHPDWPREIRP